MGAQTDTAHFASWESHTRGIGSKLMAGMGFRRNQGLGRSLAGSQAPLEVPFSSSVVSLNLSFLTDFVANAVKTDISSSLLTVVFTNVWLGFVPLAASSLHEELRHEV